MKRWLLIAISFTLLGPFRALAQEGPAKEDPAHNELRALKRGAEESFNKGDIDSLLSKYVHKDVIVTWQNAEVNHGHGEVKSFYNRMMVGPNRVVESVTTNIGVDELSHLYGANTATALGNMEQHFKLRDGLDFDLSSRWTATLVKEADQWKIAAFHVSANMFDNGVLRTALRRTAYWVGGIAGVVSLLIGIVLGRFSKRPRAA
jgi:ketosteroid isomerase-like protein